jgi:S1-C subfamily serine protease
VDTDSDIAILSIGSKLTSLPLTDIPFSPGEHVCAVANPFGLGISMSCGVISGLNRTDIGFNVIEDFIQTDAAVNPGSSGGALVNSDGRLLGMIAAIFTKEADIDAGVNFAISASLLMARVNQSPNP